jgi:hypothetical protein
MVMIDFAQIGPVAPYISSHADLVEVLAAAEQIMATTAESELDDILDSWETGLTWRSLETQPVDSAWYVRALLVICLRGLRGESAPKYHVLPGRD